MTGFKKKVSNGYDTFRDSMTIKQKYINGSIYLTFAIIGAAVFSGSVIGKQWEQGGRIDVFAALGVASVGLLTVLFLVKAVTNIFGKDQPKISAYGAADAIHNKFRELNATDGEDTQERQEFRSKKEDFGYMTRVAVKALVSEGLAQ